MTIRESVKEQWKSIKNRSLREKVSYFWDYYGIKSICLLLAVIVLIAFIVSIAVKKEYAFTGVFFGAQPQAHAEQYLKDFGNAAGIDSSQYEISVQSHLDIQMDQAITQEIYTSMETFTAMVAAKSVDCFAGDLDLFLYYGYLEYTVDLRTVLTPEELSALAPYLHYIDGKLIRQQENSNEGLANAYAQRPDSTKPELMDDPIPVGISLSAATEDFKSAYIMRENSVIGICANASYPQNALAFLRYCLDI